MAAYYRDAISPRPMRDGGMFGCRDAMRDERRGCNLCVCTDHDQMSCWRDVGGLAGARYSCGEGTLLFMMRDASTRGVWLARGPAGVPCPWLAVSCGLLSGLVTNMSYVAVECDADPGARRCGPCAAAPPAPPVPRRGFPGFRVYALAASSRRTPVSGHPGPSGQCGLPRTCGTHGAPRDSACSQR